MCESQETTKLLKISPCHFISETVCLSWSWTTELFSLEITEDLYCMDAKTLLANKISSGEIINYNISGWKCMLFYMTG